jgi:dipeptidyl aminopeptidase/acylaminoacyl peptidase
MVFSVLNTSQGHGRRLLASGLSGLAAASVTVMLSLGAANAAQAVTPPPISTYGALPAAEQLVLSPSGKLMALILNRGTQRVVVVRRLEGDRKIVQSLTLTDRSGDLQWADDDHLFVLSHRTEDTGTAYVRETGFLFMLNLKTGKSLQVAPVAEEATNGRTPDNDFNSVGLPERVLHENGRTYGYFQGGRRLYRVDLDSLQIVPVARSGEGQGDFILSPDAKIVARMEFRDHGRKWSILKGENDPTVLAQGESNIGGGRVVGLGRTPDQVLVLNSENGSTSGIREIGLKDGVVSDDLVKGPVDVQPVFDPVSRLLIGFYIGGFFEDVQFLDEAVQKRWSSVRAAFPGKKVSFESTSDDKARWIVKVEGAHDAGHFYLIDLASHQAIVLEAAYPTIADEQVGEFSWFDYTTGDGLHQKALLTLPPGYTRATARNLPAVVLPHGGPQGRDRYGFDWWAQAMASRGYAVIQPQFRGSGGFGAAFARAGWGQWGKLMQTDVSDAFKAVAAAGIVDAGRTCIVGWSYGGYATLAGVTVQTGLYRCAAAGAAVTDLNASLVWNRDRFGPQSGVIRYWKTSMGLTGEADPAGDAVSPAKLAARVTVPLMLIHGRQDTTVPLEQSQIMADALRSAGKPVEFVILENETHHIESASTRTKMLEAMTGFLARNNPVN